MGLFEILGNACNPHRETKLDWELKSTKTQDQTLYEPAEYSSYLDADCVLVVEENEDEDGEPYTLYSFLKQNGRGDITDLVCCDVKINGAQYSFSKFKDMAVKKGDKIKILSEQY